MNCKVMNDKYRRVAECVAANDEKGGTDVFLEVFRDEVNLFNENYGACHSLRAPAVIAIMESFISAMRQHGNYDASMVDNFKKCFGSVYAKGRADD